MATVTNILITSLPKLSIDTIRHEGKRAILTRGILHIVL